MTPEEVKLLVERLNAPKKVTQFNSAGELEQYEVEPSPTDFAAADALTLLAQEREELREALNTAEAVIADIAGASWGYVAPNYESGPPMTHRDLTIGRAEKYIAARSALKDT